METVEKSLKDWKDWVVKLLQDARQTSERRNPETTDRVDSADLREAFRSALHASFFIDDRRHNDDQRVRRERQHVKLARKHAGSRPARSLTANEEHTAALAVLGIVRLFDDPNEFATQCPELRLLWRHLIGIRDLNPRVSFTVNTDNFTTCTLVYIYRGTAHVWSGASRRHPNDRPNPILGQILALKRAVRSKCTKFELIPGKGN